MDKKNMELSKKDSKMIQGLSVLAMVWLHLFDTEYSGLFTPLIFIGSKPLSFLIAQLSDFCVLGFAFVSGYGHMAQSRNDGWYKHRLKGLLSTLISYWVILVSFSVVSIIAGQASFMPGSVWIFFKNALTIENSYNGAWWYIFAYAVIVLISPLLLKAAEKWHPVLLILSNGILYFAAYAVRFWIPNGGNWFLIKFGPLGMTMVEYMIGAFFFRYKFFTWIYHLWVKINRYLRLFIAIVLFGALLICRTYVIPALFFAPISGIVIIVLFHFWKKPVWIQKFFEFIGKHSTNIWLTHMFFYLVLFTNLVYIVEYPLAIFAFMIGITVVVSVLLNFIEKPLIKILVNKN